MIKTIVQCFRPEMKNRSGVMDMSVYLVYCRIYEGPRKILIKFFDYQLEFTRVEKMFRLSCPEMTY